MAKQACILFDDPKFRDKILEIKQLNEQTIDNVSKDDLIYAGPDIQAKTQLQLLKSKAFKILLTHNKDELTALQILYSKPYNLRQLTFDAS